MLRLIHPEADETILDTRQPVDYESKIREQQAREHASRDALAAIRPTWAKALIVAELEHDACDSMSDYFATTTSRVVALAWSTHTRDVFSEMRKAAARFPETAHLGPGCDVFTARVVLTNDVLGNGAAYWTGSPSHWHQDLDEGGRRFTTEAAAQAFLATAPQPEPIHFGEQLARFEWRLTREAIEHREKYSMGHGYYLKAACRYHSGWIVRKVSPGNIGRAVELEVLAEPRPEPEAASQQSAAGVTLNAERQGVEIRFPAKPPAAVLETLKAHGWRWSRFSSCWYQRDTPEARAFAARLTEEAGA